MLALDGFLMPIVHAGEKIGEKIGEKMDLIFISVCALVEAGD